MRLVLQPRQLFVGRVRVEEWLRDQRQDLARARVERDDCAVCVAHRRDRRIVHPAIDRQHEIGRSGRPMQQLGQQALDGRRRVLAAQLGVESSLQVRVAEPRAVKPEGVHQRRVDVAASHAWASLGDRQHLAVAIEDPPARLSDAPAPRVDWLVVAQVGGAPDLPVAEHQRDDTEADDERERRAAHVAAHSSSTLVRHLQQEPTMRKLASSELPP